jgi:hypothetical protein
MSFTTCIPWVCIYNLCCPKKLNNKKITPNSSFVDIYQKTDDVNNRNINTRSMITDISDIESVSLKHRTNKIAIDNNPIYYDLMKNIRNGEPLTYDEMSFIKTLPSENLIEIIHIYNINMEQIKEFL